MDIIEEQLKPNRIKSWKPMFRLENSPLWRVNGMAFTTEEEARASALALASNASLITSFSLFESTEEPNTRFLEGQNFPIEINPLKMWILI